MIILNISFNFLCTSYNNVLYDERELIVANKMLRSSLKLRKNLLYGHHKKFVNTYPDPQFFLQKLNSHILLFSQPTKFRNWKTFPISFHQLSCTNENVDSAKKERRKGERNQQKNCETRQTMVILRLSTGNTKRGSITVLLTSCLTSLKSAVWQLIIFVFIYFTG
jgi:hypothetical protein